MIRVNSLTVQGMDHHITRWNTALMARKLGIKERDMMHRVVQEISTIHQVKSWDTLLSSLTTTTSTEIRDSSTLWSRNTKLNSVSIGLKMKNVLWLSIVSLLMVKRILDSQMIHSQRISARLLWEQFIRTTKRYHVSTGANMESASSVKDAPSSMIPLRREDSSTPSQIFLKEWLCHPCQRNSRKLGTIINIKIIITATIRQLMETTQLITQVMDSISSSPRINTWATILASKTLWFK